MSRWRQILISHYSLSVETLTAGACDYNLAEHTQARDTPPSSQQVGNMFHSHGAACKSDVELINLTKYRKRRALCVQRGHVANICKGGEWQFNRTKGKLSGNSWLKIC